MGPNPDLARKIEIARPPIDKSQLAQEQLLQEPMNVRIGRIAAVQLRNIIRLWEIGEF
jgi:hypothetical protein